MKREQLSQEDLLRLCALCDGMEETTSILLKASKLAQIVFELKGRREAVFPAQGAGPTGYDLKDKCPCLTCQNQPELGMDNPVNRYMIVCHICGNKRCPKAEHHNNFCTFSNATGQPGSSYE